MGENSSIQWTDHTFNPWTRCTKVVGSPACDHCYAEQWANRAKHPTAPDGRALPLWGVDAPRNPTTTQNWRQPVKWNREAEQAGKRARVFCASLADVFEDHPAIDASGARARLFALIEATPMLDWQLLTKRPENMARLAPASWAKAWPTNVWAGCTVEDQASADKRIPHLLRVPAVVRFLSMEPLLGPVDLDPPICPSCGCRDVALSDDNEDGTLFCVECRSEMAFDNWLDPCADAKQRGVNWLIIGGESGPKARPLDLAWARSIMKQADDAGVPVFMKQMGANIRWPGFSSPGQHWPTGTKMSDAEHVRDGKGWRVHLTDSHGGDPSEWPADLQGRRAFPVARTP